jgi:DNA polymerase I
VRTLLGRIRYLPEITLPDSAKASAAERQAVNSIVQGSASDIIKLAMINMDHALMRHWPAGYPAPRLLMQIHDELVYEVSTDDPTYVALFKDILHDAMGRDIVQTLKFTVPLLVNVSTGCVWGDME